MTDAERTFDFEQAHTAFITQDALFLHTDSRYYNTFLERLGADSPWKFDQEATTPTEWVAAGMFLEARAGVVAIEDTVDLACFDGLEQALRDRSIAALLPRMHGDIAELRIVKDPAEIELMKHAQSITDKAFLHICEYIKPGLTEQTSSCRA